MKNKFLLCVAVLLAVGVLIPEFASARRDECAYLYEELQECNDCGTCCDPGDLTAIIDEIFECWGI